MVFKQLEYFIKVADLGSINKAAEALFTSQPNVSKVINSFEKEINFKVFERNARGVRLTERGQELYDYAKRIICNVEIINSIVKREVNRRLNISCYQSNMISRVLCDYYNKYKDENVEIEFLEGNVEQIIENVRMNQSDIGIVYVSENQKCCLNHTLSHKNIEFHLLDTKNSCIYVGPNNKMYNKQYINVEELATLKFVQSTRDFFSVDQCLEGLHLKNNYYINNTITTNSDHLTIDLLLTTDLSSFGIKFINKDYEQYNIKSLDIKGYDDKLLIGYIKRKNEELSCEANNFINMLKDTITTHDNDNDNQL